MTASRRYAERHAALRLVLLSIRNDARVWSAPDVPQHKLRRMVPELWPYMDRVLTEDEPGGNR